MSASFSAPRLRPRQLSAGDLVEESLLDPANGYLRIVRARQPGMDLRQWIAAAGAGLRDSLLRHGGILFRGFAVDGAEGFSQAVQGFFAEHARLPGARGGAPGSGAPGVHFHRVLAGWLDSAAPRNVLLA